MPWAARAAARRPLSESKQRADTQDDPAPKDEVDPQREKARPGDASGPGRRLNLSSRRDRPTGQRLMDGVKQGHATKTRNFAEVAGDRATASISSRYSLTRTNAALIGINQPAKSPVSSRTICAADLVNISMKRASRSAWSPDPADARTTVRDKPSRTPISGAITRRSPPRTRSPDGDSAYVWIQIGSTPPCVQ